MAMAAAGMIGCAHAETNEADTMTAANNATTDLVHCYGVNECKGHNDCKTADNACAGHSSCEGTGFVAMPSEACDHVGGELQDEWRGSIAQADLVHCSGVNTCKGHNDCKTATNNCAGHASCEGTGFVSMPAKACGDIGGEVTS